MQQQHCNTSLRPKALQNTLHLSKSFLWCPFHPIPSYSEFVFTISRPHPPIFFVIQSIIYDRAQLAAPELTHPFVLVSVTSLLVCRVLYVRLMIFDSVHVQLSIKEDMISVLDGSFGMYRVSKAVTVWFFRQLRLGLFLPVSMWFLAPAGTMIVICFCLVQLRNNLSLVRLGSLLASP
jgi:hypothetical protein